jgi:hemerythrin-like domain-containing protein
MLADIESLNNAGEFDESFKKFEKYNHELLNHIAVEDDEVFQMALSILDSDDLDKIYYRFLDTDSNLGMDNKLAMEKMVN